MARFGPPADVTDVPVMPVAVSQIDPAASPTKL
jgi:hypothetical protein